MTRRIDVDTAEKVSMALLTRTAFGTDAGLRHALSVGVEATLITRIFGRGREHLRKDGQGSTVLPDRRSFKRGSDQ